MAIRILNQRLGVGEFNAGLGRLTVDASVLNLRSEYGMGDSLRTLNSSDADHCGFLNGLWCIYRLAAPIPDMAAGAGGPIKQGAQAVEVWHRCWRCHPICIENPIAVRKVSKARHGEVCERTTEGVLIRQVDCRLTSCLWF